MTGGDCPAAAAHAENAPCWTALKEPWTPLQHWDTGSRKCLYSRQDDITAQGAQMLCAGPQASTAGAVPLLLASNVPCPRSERTHAQLPHAFPNAAKQGQHNDQGSGFAPVAPFSRALAGSRCCWQLVWCQENPMLHSLHNRRCALCEQPCA